MHFFNWQQDAQRRTRWLLILLGLAILLLATGLYLLLSLALLWQQELPLQLNALLALWHWPHYALTLASVAALVLLGSLYKHWELGAGGSALASKLGGRPVSPDSQDPYERRLLNLVEEMAIASGMPVPQVYLLDYEGGINAFAAGYEFEDAVIGVTRGALHQLNRDELEGVIAHEFSHIAHGDMRLNLRLISLVFGLTLLAELGHILLRASSGRRQQGGLALAGLALLVLGYAGSFCAGLIKAAVSRNREYLADASAVQYTRNPDGLANALKRIGAAREGSELVNLHAGEAAHLMFANTLDSFMALWATHPPLAARIRKLDPHWQGHYQLPAVTPLHPPAAPHTAEAEATAPAMASLIISAASGAMASQQQLQQAKQSMGAPTPAHRHYAQQWLTSLPLPLASASHQPQQASLLALALWLEVLPGQRPPLQSLGHANLQQLAQLERALQSWSGLRLPLFERCLSSLASCAPDLRRTLLQLSTEQAKQHPHLLAEGMRLLLEQHLHPPRSVPLTSRRLRQAGQHLLPLLAQLCHASAMPSPQALAVLQQQCQALGLAPPTQLPQAEANQLNLGIRQARQLQPSAKAQLLEACMAICCHDEQLRKEEVEALRLLALLLGCPLPPLLPSDSA
ncbi:M48 family metallopeptidase [Balneatrix alpica]|uniref:M48 family metallopeptidase n=1 Tax=Balneatrix alpica TaxID=75684 RepID=A0ABV5ZBM6_9GAMM|nr:M48 family metallopeptidase [Balneatrix alpica]